MKSKRMLRILSPAVACALLLLPGIASAEFTLDLPSITLQVLDTDVDTDSAKFSEYSDWSSGLQILELDIRGRDSESDRYLDIYGTKVWRDDARMSLGYGVRGSYDIWVDYNKIPHNFGNNAKLLWNRVGNNWAIADPVQADLQAAIEAAPARDFDFIDSLISPHINASDTIDLGIQRDRFATEVDFRSMRKFAWGVEYKHENRTGTRPFGGTFGFNNANEIPEIIDYDTTDAVIRGEFNTENGGLQFGYRYSMFENSNDVMTWDNPFRIDDATNPIAYLAPTTTPFGPNGGIIDLAPDNESNTLFLSGRGRFAGSWWAAGNLSLIEMEQNDPLQPYTVNTAITGISFPSMMPFDPTVKATLPVQNADTSVDVLNFTADVGTDFGDDWKLKLFVRYYDYDNSSPRVEFDGYVRTHAVWEEVPRITVPYSYTKQDIGAEIAWDVSRDARLALLYKMREWDREFRETNSTEEDILRLTYDQNFGQRVQLRGHWETADRTYDSYTPEAQFATFVDPHDLNNQPGLRKYIQANRDYDDWELSLNFYPSDTWQILFGLNGLDEEYPDSEFGLVTNELMRYNFEVSYTPGEDLNFFVFAHASDGESFQRARQSGGTLSTNPADNWDLTLTDDNEQYGLGLNARLTDRWTTNIITQYQEADGFLDFFTPAGGSPSQAVDIDNYDDSELFFFKIRCQYELNAQAAVGFGYWYEDYKLDTELLQGLENYTAGLIALVSSNGDYTANVLSLDLKLSF